MYALANGRIYTGYDVLEDHAIVIEGNQIKEICLHAQLDQSMTCLDVHGQVICAGFIDLQLNGCGGVMFNDEITDETIHIMHQTNLKSGCTSFLPTLITSSDEDIYQAVAAARSYHQQYVNHSLGLHLEGPFLNAAKKGIHREHFIRPLSDEMVDYLCANSDLIAKVTLAPEQNVATHLRQLSQAGIVVAIGHSNATYEQAIDGFKNGIRFATHLFNAMSPMQGREPGVVGAIYDTTDVYAGIIADGFHVDYANIRIAHKIKGDRLVLVTDATAPAGTDIDQFNFVGQTVYYRDGKCIDENGTLGGSALTMIEAVENVVKHAGIALDEAIRMATLYPAKAIGVADSLGVLHAGKIANITVFDADYQVTATIVNGQHQSLIS